MLRNSLFYDQKLKIKSSDLISASVCHFVLHTRAPHSVWFLEFLDIPQDQWKEVWCPSSCGEICHSWHLCSLCVCFTNISAALLPVSHCNTCISLATFFNITRLLKTLISWLKPSFPSSAGFHEPGLLCPSIWHRSSHFHVAVCLNMSIKVIKASRDGAGAHL